MRVSEVQKSMFSLYWTGLVVYGFFMLQLQIRMLQLQIGLAVL